MTRILIVYGTTEGHTAKIANRLATVIQGDGHEVELRSSKEVRKQDIADAFDGILVGGSIHAGAYQGSLRKFVKRNRKILERRPSWFFSVSLSAADPDEESMAETNVNLERFTHNTGWRPARTEAIGGALVYTQYNLFVRHLMKLIAKQHGRTELDTSRDFDFTDWAAVDRLGHDFAASVAASTKAPAKAKAVTRS